MRCAEKREQKKKQRKVGRYPFLIKMVLTIYLLICVPMIIVQIFILRSSYHELSTQNDTYCYTETKNLSSRMFSQISAFRTIALKISNTNQTSIKKYLNADAPESLAISASEELSNYRLSVPMAKHIGIYYIDRTILLDDQYYYKLENFCSSFSNGDLDTYNRVYGLFTEPFEGRYRMISSIRSDKASEAEMIVAIPVRMSGYDKYDAIVYFTMTYSSMNSFLTTSFSENSTYAIFNQYGDLFFTNHTTNIGDLKNESFVSYLKNETQNKFYFQSDGAFAYKWNEDSAPYTFVTIVEKSQFEENSAAFFSTMELLLLVNIILTAILVAVTVYINYNPLHKLVEKISTHGQNTDSSELGRIENAIAELDNRTSDQSMVIMDYVLNDLLYGTSVRQQQLTVLMPNLDCHNFCAVSVLCSRPTTEQSRRISDEILRSIGCQIFITDMPNKEYSLFVCLSKQEIVPEALARTIEASVQNILSESCKVFVGTVVTSLDDIPLSYYASQAEAGGEPGFVYTKDYPATEIQLFTRQIETANLESARESLNTIFECSRKNIHNRTLCRYINYEVLIAYISARKRTSYPMNDSELKNLLAFTNANHLQHELEASIAAMEQQVSRMNTDANTTLPNEIVDFVDENYYKTDISLINVADRFGISIYMLSRLFKSRTGIGFKEYITAKRLELACRLLITTKDNISIIALNSGFENPTYFASIFKAHYGMTPSKYRESTM